MEVRGCLGAQGQRVGQWELGSVFLAPALFLTGPALLAITC